ncbi:MAG: acetyl-CoA carboxylase biotin carboxyl carrier protein [Clostridium butyricum]|jgi:acetyl-CoA carboxylase biotin carboxyl carrier protein|nr:acetyl-CoA carboxylase biotin carboxyl carrier protein [Clostridium butyricum]
MDFEQIKELIKLVDSSELAFFEISTQCEHIKMDKSLDRNLAETTVSSNNSNSSPTVQSITKNIVGKNEGTINNENSLNLEEKDDEDVIVITSPMVGTFYSKPSPDSALFVSVGDRICKGKVLCIIEAMKLMNEIESEYDGTIVKCLVNEGDMVEYGQPLFKIKGE